MVMRFISRSRRLSRLLVEDFPELAGAGVLLQEVLTLVSGIKMDICMAPLASASNNIKLNVEYRS
jgi:hypothetical protein